MAGTAAAAIVAAKKRKYGAARHSLDRVNKKSRECSMRGIPPMFSKELRGGLVFISEPVAVEFLIDKGLLDVYAKCQFLTGEADDVPELVDRDCCGANTKFKRKWDTDIQITVSTTQTVKKGDSVTVALSADELLEKLGSPLHGDCLKVRCDNKTGRHTQSIQAKSIVSGSHLRKNSFLQLAYEWCMQTPIGRASERTGIRRQCVTQQYKFFREAVMSHVLDDADSLAIGGINVIVEIDESKFGKRKYHRGKRIYGNWVFGGIERLWDEEKQKYVAGQVFQVVVDKRDTPTLKEAILRFIKPGSVIISDCWKAYDGIPDFQWTFNGEPCQYTHYNVNHSKWYKDPITGACTNTIEGWWRIAKKDIPGQHYQCAETLQEHLYEGTWRQRFKGDVWNQLLATMAEVRYLQVDGGEQGYLKKNVASDGTVCFETNTFADWQKAATKSSAV